MDRDKIQTLLTEKGVAPLLWSIDEDTKNQILSNLKNILNIDYEILKNAYQGEFEDSNLVLYGTITNEFDFKMQDMIAAVAADVVPSKIYYSDDGLKNMDAVDSNQFFKYFLYYWYSGYDDIVILDPQYKWLFFIRHDGAIFVSKNARPSEY